MARVARVKVKHSSMPQSRSRRKGDDGLTDRQRRDYAAEWRETGARKPDAAELRRILAALDAKQSSKL